MTTWRMRIASWIPKATNTHSEYVILIAFLLKQLLHERAWKLRLCVHCLSCFCTPLCKERTCRGLFLHVLILVSQNFYHRGAQSHEELILVTLLRPQKEVPWTCHLPIFAEVLRFPSTILPRILLQSYCYTVHINGGRSNRVMSLLTTSDFGWFLEARGNLRGIIP